ncbi:hypothetical protein THAOC_14177 [Thalassiosira oceanica]|uniref:Uncharacterized protein n=1 Tax=Thalassiosira oceanica TaxID=159749 RepID=K0SI23_THAOC|nr:hypothetical protein THAOC_14177 [Thalassiosira oceanica]|eukprot:EJK65025.1 hypothetical protein THAOC_14177 [Thalassiosira oceanica]
MIYRQRGEAERHLEHAAWVPQKQQQPLQLEKPPSSTAMGDMGEDPSPPSQRPSKRRRKQVERYEPETKQNRRKKAKKVAKKVAKKALVSAPHRSCQAKSTAATAALIENSQRAARDLQEVRTLISNIGVACMDELIVMGDYRGRTKSFLEGLVKRYQPEYAGLTYDKLWEALRFELGYEMFGGETEELTTKKELEGLLPAVIEKTDSLMEEYRKKKLT